MKASLGGDAALQQLRAYAQISEQEDHADVGRKLNDTHRQHLRQKAHSMLTCLSLKPKT